MSQVTAPFSRLLRFGKYILVVHGNCISQLIPAENGVSAEYILSPVYQSTKAAVLLLLTVSLPRAKLAICEVSKCVSIFDMALDNAGHVSLALTATFSLPKTLTGLVFDDDHESVLASDKFGDVYRLPTIAAKGEVGAIERLEPIMGHVSMVTDICVMPSPIAGNDKVIVTADRDEKIRLTLLSKPYIIEQYLLQHKQYVSVLCPLNEESLVSAGGDDTAFIWKWHKDLYSESVCASQTIDLVALSNGRLTSGKVDVIAVIASDDGSRLAFFFEREHFIMLLKAIRGEYSILKCQELPALPLSAIFVNPNLLLVSTVSNAEALLQVSIDSDSIQPVLKGEFNGSFGQSDIVKKGSFLRKTFVAKEVVGKNGQMEGRSLQCDEESTHESH